MTDQLIGQSLREKLAPMESMAFPTLEQCSIGLLVIGPDHRVINWNRWMVESSGIGVEQAVGSHLYELFPQIAGSPLASAIVSAAEGGETTLLPSKPGVTLLTLHPGVAQPDDESEVAQLVIVKPLLEHDRHVLLQVFDPTAIQAEPTEFQRRMSACRKRKLYTDQVLSSIADAVITTNIQGHVNYMNVVAEKLTGWRSSEATGLPLAEVFQVAGESGDSLYGAIGECLASGNLPRTTHQELVLNHRDGIAVAVDESIAPVRDEKGQLHGIVVVFRDVSQERRLAAQVSWQAAHDVLTGLVNRVSFDRKLEQLLQEARQTGRIHSMLYLDLDQFKIVNDTCGHIAGDELLRQIARMLTSHVRSDDTLARLGGDEFGVLLADCNDLVAQRIANQMRQSILDFRFGWDGKFFSIGVSIGLVTITSQSESVERVLSAADAACYAAKDGGRNQVHLYRVNKGEAARRQGEMRWVSRLHEALDERRFRLYVQPIVPVEPLSGEPGHYEVLIRMLDESGELIYPGDFIPAAERFGLMPKIDRWVVSELFGLIGREYQRLVAGGCRFAINLSGGSVNDDDTLRFIGHKMSEFKIPEGMISFEITETAAIANLTSANHFMRTLKKAGCRFSLDDFGSGLSSFAYLKNLPVDYLKIDGAFVRDLANDPIDRAMVQAINQVGQVMGLKTIAEFVEDEAILEQLRTIGVDYAQGYGIARPTPLADGEGRLLLERPV